MASKQAAGVARRPSPAKEGSCSRAQCLSCQRVFGYRHGLIAEIVQGSGEVRHEFGGEGEGFQRRAGADRRGAGYADGECSAAARFRVRHCSPYPVPWMNGRL